MSKTPQPAETNPAPPPQIEYDPSAAADAVGCDKPVPENDIYAEMRWTAERFATALLANPRADQILRLSPAYTPTQLGGALAQACVSITVGFKSTLRRIERDMCEHPENAQ